MSEWKGSGPPDHYRTARKVDAQAPATADQKRPPIRTFWHALYYPEQRRVKLSYYLRDDGDRIVRSDYQEFRLETTNAPAPPSTPSPLAAAAGCSPGEGS